jgi:hypothetical protein
MVTPDGAPPVTEINTLDWPTLQHPTFEKIGDFRGLSNPDSTPENENPGALAGATGAMSNEQVFKSKDYLKRAEAATTLCLAIADCDRQDACEIMEAALLDLGAGQPRPPLFSVMDEAAEWADFAITAELKAYALACFNRMRPADQSAFLAYVGRAA